MPIFPSLLTGPAEILATPFPLHPSNGETLIIGMPKSGTTAVARLFAACAGLTVCSDPFHKLDERGIRFRQRLFDGNFTLETLWRRHRLAFRGKVVKDPNFPLLLDQLVEMKPHGNFVFLVRDPRANLRSILNRLKLPGNLEQLDASAFSLPSTWTALLEGSTPQMPGENYVEHLAWRWRRSAEAYVKHKARCLLVRYEDFNANKIEAIEELVQRCGYKPRNSIAHLIDVQFQPKGQTSTSFQEFFGDNNLEAINRIVGPVLEEFGYSSH